MPLTRRPRNVEGRFESWLIFDGDLGVGRIEERQGVPLHVDKWQWSCGFYPGCDLRTQIRNGTAETFDAARAAFQQAWDWLEPQVTPAMRLEWLRDRAYAAWKYQMKDLGYRMPTANTTGRSKCFCGADITIADAAAHIYAEHMGTKP